MGKIDSNNVHCSICTLHKNLRFMRESTEQALRFECMDCKGQGEKVIKTYNMPDSKDEPENYSEFMKLRKKFMGK